VRARAQLGKGTKGGFLRFLKIIVIGMDFTYRRLAGILLIEKTTIPIQLFILSIGVSPWRLPGARMVKTLT
jgi:hypothetical protein